MDAGVRLVRDIIDALNRGDLDGMLARMDAAFEWTPLESSVAGRVYTGHAEVRRYVEDWLATFDGLRLELEEATAVRDRVVAVVRGSATGRSGLALNNKFCQLWTLRAGTALAMEEHPTREDALGALGAPQR